MNVCILFDCLVMYPLSLHSISNSISCLIQRPLPVLPASSDSTYSPTLEPEPFIFLLGKQRLLQAQHKCFDRMQKLPPYQGEGKKKAVCERVFQALVKAYFLPWVNMLTQLI